jgi:hypothetical protein
MPPAGLTLLAPTTRSASQALFPALFRLALLASSVVEFVRFNGPLYLALHLIGQGGIAHPPTPAIAGPDMDAHLSGDATRRTRQAQQEGGENPVRQRPLTVGQQRVREVIGGAPTAVAPVAFQPWPIMVSAPGTEVVAVTAGTLERAIFPPEHMEIGLAGIGIEELV